jgi:hypothetical protein
MLPKPLDALTIADFEELVRADVGESTTLEFKRELPGSGDGGNVKILREITALANTYGGDLLYGIEERDSIAVAVPGIPNTGMGEQVLRIESLLRQGVEPPLVDVQIRPVDIDDARCVLVLRVRKAWSGPHRVTSKGHAHFYGRNSKESFPMDVTALRAAFGQSELVVERAERFRSERVQRLLNQRAVVRQLFDGALLALHVVPIASFAAGSSTNLWPPSDKRLQHFYPEKAGVSCADPTFEGFVLFDDRRGPSTAYCHVYRTGCVELVHVLRPVEMLPSSHKYWIVSPWVEQFAILNTERYTAVLENYGVSGPFLVGLSLIGAQSYALDVERAPAPYMGSSATLGREWLQIQSIYMEQGVPDASAIWRPFIDRIYNAFRREGSPYWKDDKWIARRL